VTDRPRMAAPVGFPVPPIPTHSITEQEEQARACLVVVQTTNFETTASSPGTEHLLQAFPPGNTVVRTLGAATGVVAGCAEEALKTVLTCGGMLALAPETLGASVLAAIPCAIQAMGFGRCVAGELAREDDAAIRQAAEAACLERGGIPISTDSDVTCFTLRDR